MPHLNDLPNTLSVRRLCLIACALAALALATGWPDPAYAGNHNSGGGGGGPTPISVSEFRTLEFGSVSSSTSGTGTATVSATGVKSTSGYAINMGGSHRAAEFRVTGEKNTEVTITLPSSPVTVTNSTGQTATLHSFSSSPSATATLDNKGKLTIYVGATLTVPAGANEGDYSGTFIISVIDPLNP
ncbi:MAG: DUF4402 domain-containing protein [Rhodospirillales bacterium]